MSQSFSSSQCRPDWQRFRSNARWCLATLLWRCYPYRTDQKPHECLPYSTNKNRLYKTLCLLIDPSGPTRRKKWASPTASKKLIVTYVLLWQLCDLEAVTMLKDLYALDLFYKGLWCGIQSLMEGVTTEAVYRLTDPFPVEGGLHIRIQTLFGAIARPPLGLPTETSSRVTTHVWTKRIIVSWLCERHNRNVRVDRNHLSLFKCPMGPSQM